MTRPGLVNKPRPTLLVPATGVGEAQARTIPHPLPMHPAPYNSAPLAPSPHSPPLPGAENAEVRVLEHTLSMHLVPGSSRLDSAVLEPQSVDIAREVEMARWGARGGAGVGAGGCGCGQVQVQVRVGRGPSCPGLGSCWGSQNAPSSRSWLLRPCCDCRREVAAGCLRRRHTPPGCSVLTAAGFAPVCRTHVEPWCSTQPSAPPMANTQVAPWQPAAAGQRCAGPPVCCPPASAAHRG